MFVAICVALLVGGLALVAYGLRRFVLDRQMTAAASGLCAQGEIISASLDIKDSMGADQERLTIYRPIVLYRYAVAGDDHIGSRVWLTRDSFPGEQAARHWLAAHPAGGEVVVHVDPARPDQAALVLDRPSVVTALVTVGLGVIFAWTGLSLLMES